MSAQTFAQLVALAAALSAVSGAIAPFCAPGGLPRKVLDAIAHLGPGNVVGAVRAFTNPSGTPTAASPADRVQS